VKNHQLINFKKNVNGYKFGKNYENYELPIYNSIFDNEENSDFDN
jgi:hypothetical protein